MSREYWLEFKRAEGRGEVAVTVCPKDLDPQEERNLNNKISDLMEKEGWKRKL